MMRNPVYASTACVAAHHPTLGDLLAALAGAGLSRVELGHCPPLAGLALPGALPGPGRQWLVHNYFPPAAEPFVLNLAAPDPATLRRSREFAAAAIRLCAALGAPFYSVHCGFLAELRPGSLGRKLEHGTPIDYETGYATFCASLESLLSEAGRAGIRLLLEPNVVARFNLVDGRNTLLMMAEPAEFGRLLGDIRDARLGILLDLGHLRVAAATLGFAPAEFIDAVAPAISAFHLHDNDGTADQHRPVTADSWAVEVLREPRFAGKPVVVEAGFPSIDALAQHCAWLENLLNRPFPNPPWKSPSACN